MAPKTHVKSDTKAMSSAMMGFNPMAATTWQALMSQSARFLAERTQEGLKIQQDMLTCKTPMELMKLQSDFYGKAAQQYTQEATRMMKLMSVPSTKPRDFDDVPV